MHALDYVILAVVAGVLILCGLYLYRSKKKGRACVGCPGNCGSCGGNCGTEK
jgi:hypothetical protein